MSCAENNTSLTGLAKLESGGIAAFVGCGGKTSIINLLATENAQKKVLISPTTKIRPPKGVPLCDTVEKCAAHAPRAGVQTMGISNEETGKLEALPMGKLESIVRDYDLALLEADGSFSLPCKGWREYEPVVPAFCTHTVGVAAIGAVGRIVCADTVFRLPVFLKLTGAKEGDRITIKMLAEMICASGGMLKNAVGRRIFIANQVESEEAKTNARALLGYIQQKWKGLFDGMIYGSARNNAWDHF